jgi:hypothetical protein
MNEDLLDYWIRIIKPILPANAWVDSRLSKGDYVIRIDWKLENDPQRQNRRSRKIEIIIKEEAIDDYLDKNISERALSDTKMKQWISKRYNDFRIDQDINISNSSYPDRWRISKDMLG